MITSDSILRDLGSLDKNKKRALISKLTQTTDEKIIEKMISLLDDDDIGQTIDLVFSSGSGDLDATAAGGTAIDVDDDSSSVPGSILGIVTISNYFDGINWKIGTKENIGLVLKADSTTRSIYVSAVNRGATSTWTAAGLHLKLGIVKD